jgi:hypothetical protein
MLSVQSKREGTRKTPKVYTHFRVICVSMFKTDLVIYQEMLAKLKARGHRRANLSGLIRLALAQLDIDSIDPREMR